MIPPKMLTYELMSLLTAESDALSAPANQRIIIHGFLLHQHVTASATVTDEAKLFFGTDPNNKHKRLASYQQDAAGEEASISISGLSIWGLIGEPVTLINATFAPGTIHTDCVIYYSIL